MGCKEPDAIIILCSICRFAGSNGVARTLEEILETEKPEIVAAAQAEAERILKAIEDVEERGGDQQEA